MKTPAPPLDHGSVPWLLALALASAGPHAGHLPSWLPAIAALVLGWRGWLWRTRRPLPPRWLVTLLALAGVAGIALQFRSLFGRDAGVALLVLFMAFKPLEMHARRDALVLVMLAFFLLLTHYFYSQSIPTGLGLLATATLAAATLIRLHGGRQPVAAIARQAALMLLQALPFMLVLFALFPRISGPLWGLPQDAHAGSTGLGDTMAPGSISQLIQSGAIAFRAQFGGKAPAQHDLYWRGPVLDDYDGQTWRQRPPPSPRPPQIEARSRPIDYALTLEPHNQRWLLALDAPTALPPEARLSYGLEALAREPVHSRTRFVLRSALDYRANADETATVLRQSLQLPAGFNPRSRALAASWQQGGSSAAGIAEQALDLFRRENFVYTLRPPLLGRDAMDDFLFATRRGFCEHYASAFVYLMRAAGVPARVVSGYQGGEINPVDGYLVVRQSDAHAWAEIWIAGRGWRRVDPTAAIAPSRVEQGIGAALPATEALPAMMRVDLDWLRELRFRWEAANNRWNQWVLGYNPQRQREMLSRLGFEEADWRHMAAALAALCGLALLAITWWSLRQRPTRDPALRAWLRFCSRLARLGIARQAWEGPLDFAARVARERPEFAAVTADAAARYARLRYGRSTLDEIGALRACTARLPRPWRLV